MSGVRGRGMRRVPGPEMLNRCSGRAVDATDHSGNDLPELSPVSPEDADLRKRSTFSVSSDSRRFKRIPRNEIVEQGRPQDAVPEASLP